MSMRAATDVRAMRRSSRRVAMLLAVLVVASCSTGGNSARWETVQSGADIAISWRLYRTELPLTGTAFESTCLAFETQPPTPQKYGEPPNGVYPKTLRGKVPFCGVPNVANPPDVARRLRLSVLGANLDASAGTHDVFGVVDPEVTNVAASFSDGNNAEGDVQSGTFVVVWNGPKTLRSLTALAGERALSECFPDGQTISFNSNDDKDTASFACRLP